MMGKIDQEVSSDEERIYIGRQAGSTFVDGLLIGVRVSRSRL